jgi:hypothetical protein
MFNKNTEKGMAMHQSKLQRKQSTKMLQIRKHSLTLSQHGCITCVSVLKSLMDPAAVLKTFHGRAGASMDAWKEKNTAWEVKGSTDGSFRADLKSKVSQATNEAR